MPAGNLYAAATYSDPANLVTRDFTDAPPGVASPPGAFGADCTTAACDDGTVTLGCEQCDDGNLVDGDGCGGACTATACGNAVVTAGEACDDGDAISGDGCDANCTVTACGNDIMTSAEQCEDGNATSGDGCDASCALDCQATPDAGCAVPTRPGRSKLSVRDKGGTEADALQWKLKGAVGATPVSFGKPTATTVYRLCLYTSAASIWSVAVSAGFPSGAECPTPPCWRTSRGGFAYRSDRSGRVSLELSSRDGTTATVSLKAKGASGLLGCCRPCRWRRGPHWSPSCETAPAPAGALRSRRRRRAKTPPSSRTSPTERGRGAWRRCPWPARSLRPR